MQRFLNLLTLIEYRKCLMRDKMGFLDNLFGGSGGSDEIDIEEYLREDVEEGDAITPPADSYVKKIDLRNEGDAEGALKEVVKNNNIIILNLKPLIHQPNRLKSILSKVKTTLLKKGGDIAAISPELVLLTPKKIRIVKSKK